MIWFAGSGAVKAVWCNLAVPLGEDAEAASPLDKGSGFGCGHKLCNELAALQTNGQYARYVAIAEGLLRDRNRIMIRLRKGDLTSSDPSEEEKKRQ